MAGRVIRDDISRSRSLCEVSLVAELFYPRLWLACDEFGVFEYDVDMLVATIFPRRLARQSVSVDQVEEWIQELARDHVLLFEVAGIQYGYCRHWSTFNRFRTDIKPKYPPPPPFVGKDGEDLRLSLDREQLTQIEEDYESLEKQTVASPPRTAADRRESPQPVAEPEASSNNPVMPPQVAAETEGNSTRTPFSPRVAALDSLTRLDSKTRLDKETRQETASAATRTVVVRSRSGPVEPTEEAWTLANRCWEIFTRLQPGSRLARSGLMPTHWSAEAQMLLADDIPPDQIAEACEWAFSEKSRNGSFPGYGHLAMPLAKVVANFDQITAAMKPAEDLPSVESFAEMQARLSGATP